MNISGMSEKDLHAILDHPEHFDPETVEAAKKILDGNEQKGWSYIQKENNYEYPKNNIPPKKTPQSSVGCGCLLFIILIVVVIITRQFFDTTEKNNSTGSYSKSLSLHIGDLVKIQKISIGCINESDLDKLRDYGQDSVAIEKEIKILILSGRAISFEKGEEVYYVDLRIWKELVKLRRKGDIQEYWTFRDVIY